MTHRDRDASIERLLREAREMTAEVRPASECLDAETLGAWSEGALLESERLTAEAHASRCSRCQAALAAMARTLPPSTSAPSPMRRWIMLLVPATAAAAALALWVAVDRQAGRGPADAPASFAAPSVDSQPASAPPDLGKESAASPRANAASKDQALGDRKADERVDVTAGAPQVQTVTAEPSVRARNEVDAVASKTAPSLPAPVVAPSPPPASPPAAAPVEPNDSLRRSQQTYITPSQQTEQRQALQQPGQQAAKPERYDLKELEAKFRDQQQRATEAQAEPVIPAEPVRPPAPAAVAGASADSSAAAGGRGGALAETVTVVTGDSKRAATATGIGVRQEATATFDVVSPTRSTRWRIVDGLTVERSIDAGATWRRQHRIQPPQLLVAGASPTPASCWLVGRGGLVLRTVDGRTWQRVKFPESVDLRAVSAAHPDVATVVTADGRTFATANAGGTWVAQK